ncbi:MarR family winged helix-turn-helix transcriptional regulator [Cumulibacter soli]|uniref:MarR family winged helix-turn-helix transcriptional regulator n=1 Tax=Cumulibacter soli TaxID=2546344 RepID=UPI0010677414|nr:MarR family transcriptional regulator [Cumulibacter soli]
MSTRWLNKEEATAWVRLVALLELLPAGLDSQVRRDSGVTNFEFYVLVVLSESADQQLRMTELAAQCNASLPRLSHVVRRLESRDLVERALSADDRRSRIVRLSATGLRTLEETTPHHLEYVREHVIDVLTPEQIGQLRDIAEAILNKLDPNGALGPIYHRHDDRED